MPSASLISFAGHELVTAKRSDRFRAAAARSGVFSIVMTSLLKKSLRAGSIVARMWPARGGAGCGNKVSRYD
jgi:hypothetical protein